MLRIEDAERLQVHFLLQYLLLFVPNMVLKDFWYFPPKNGSPVKLIASCVFKGFPVGFTAPCYPIQPPGLNSHKQRPVKDNEVDVWESKRFALLGNAVTVQVGYHGGRTFLGLMQHNLILLMAVLFVVYICSGFIRLEDGWVRS